MQIRGYIALASRFGWSNNECRIFWLFNLWLFSIIPEKIRIRSIPVNKAQLAAQIKNQKHLILEEHPDTKLSIRELDVGIEVVVWFPYWEKLLPQ